MRGVSVIICCYNSEFRLLPTLSHLSQQQGVRIPWEIILVDNNSTDQGIILATHFWATHGLVEVPMHIVSEPCAGLSFARSTGVSKSIYDYVIFCDDDNWLAPNYIQRAYDAMSSDSAIGILGGLNTAVAASSFPAWFEEMQLAYACGPQAAQNGEVERRYITGAGMVVRKRLFSILHEIGFASQLSDRRGEELSSGGDSEICFVAWMLGFKLVYNSDLQLQHYMEPGRLTWSYFVQMTLGHARSGYKLGYYTHEQTGVKYGQSWWSELMRLTKNNLRRSPVRLLVNYFHCRSNVSHLPQVIDMMEIEKWWTHLRMIGHYSSFVQRVQAIKVAATHYKK